jgi:hypothetical protein
MDLMRDTRFEEAPRQFGLSFEEDIRPGANYEVAVENDGEIYVSGMIPRVRGVIAVTGRVGEKTSLEEARQAARISTLRALAILRKSLGSLAGWPYFFAGWLLFPLPELLFAEPLLLLPLLFCGWLAWACVCAFFLAR